MLQHMRGLRAGLGCSLARVGSLTWKEFELVEPHIAAVGFVVGVVVLLAAKRLVLDVDRETHLVLPVLLLRVGLECRTAGKAGTDLSGKWLLAACMPGMHETGWPTLRRA